LKLNDKHYQKCAPAAGDKGLFAGEYFYDEESEIQGTFWGSQRDKARVCSLCEVISHAETLKGHLDFFIRAFQHGHAPLTERSVWLYSNLSMF